MLRGSYKRGREFLRYRSFTRGLKHWFFAGALALVGLTTPAAAEQARLLVLGDSLTAGYGLPQDKAFPVLLEQALRKRGIDVKVLNAGVSGDTTAGGLARIDWALADKPTHAIVELGANDALRGVDPATTRTNLDRLVARLTGADVKTLLAGMYAPPNWGKAYEVAFRELYPSLARKHGVMLYPFFLDGVAADETLNQPDGIHPNARGVSVIVDRILPYVVRLLDDKE